MIDSESAGVIAHASGFVHRHDRFDIVRIRQDDLLAGGSAHIGVTSDFFVILCHSTKRHSSYRTHVSDAEREIRDVNKKHTHSSSDWFIC